MASQQKSAAKAGQKRNVPKASMTTKSLKLASFAVLSQEPLHKVLATVIICFHVLQAYFLTIEAAFYSFSTTGSGMEVAMKLFSDFILARNVINIEDPKPPNLVFLSGIMLYLACNIGIVAFCLARFLNVKPIPHWFMRNWKNIGQIHVYCLFLPTHNVLAEIIIQSYKTGLTSSLSWILVVLAIILDIFNVGLVILQLITDLNIKTGDPLSMLDNTFLKVDYIRSITISLLNLLILHYKLIIVPGIVLNLINVILAAVFAAAFIIRLPFFSNVMFIIFVVEIGATVCSAVICLILSTLDTIGFYVNQSMALFVVLLTIPIYVKSALNFINCKKALILSRALHYFSNRGVKKNFNKFWFIHSIFSLKAVLETKIHANLLSAHYKKKMLLHLGHRQHLYSFLLNKDFIENMNKRQELSAIIVKFAEAWLRRHPKDDLAKLILADFLITDFKSLYGPYVLIEQVLTHNDSLNYKLSALKIRETIQNVVKIHNIDNNSKLDLTLLFEGSQLFGELKEKILMQIQESNKFFQYLKDKNPSLSLIMKSGKKTEIAKKKVEDCWNGMSTHFVESYLPLLLAYGIYKLTLNFEYREGNELLQKYSNLLKKKDHYRNSGNIDDHTILSENNVSFLISASKSDLGAITHCGENTKKIFGEKAQNLIGRNINVLMPRFFHDIHDKMIQKKLESSDNLLKLKYFPSFAKDRQDFIFPVNIFISLFPLINRGFFFSGIVRPLKDRLSYLLLDEHGYIDSYSKQLKVKLNLPTIHPSIRINIASLCSAFEQINHALTNCSKSGFSKQETSTNVLDLNSLTMWPDLHTKPHEYENDNKVKEDDIQTTSPDHKHYTSSSRHGKSKFSVVMSSNQNLKEAEIEAIKSEMTIKGKILSFRPYRPERTAGTLRSLKSHKNTIFNDHTPGSSNAAAINRVSVPTVIHDASNFIHYISRKILYYRCRIDVKKYCGKVLHVLIMEETSPPAEEAAAHQRIIAQSKRFSLRRQIIPFANKKQNMWQQGQTPPKLKEDFSFFPSHSEAITLPPIKLQEVEESSNENYVNETDEAANGIYLPNFEEAHKTLNGILKNNQGKEDSSSDRSHHSAIPTYNDSNGNLQSYTLDTSPIMSISPTMKRGRATVFVGVDSADKNNVKNESRHRYSVGHVSPNTNTDTDHYRKRSSESISSRSRQVEFDIHMPPSQNEAGTSNIGIGESLKSKPIKTKFTTQLRLRSVNISDYIHTLKFYQFSQAKIPFLWLIVCLIALLVCGTLIFLIAKDTIPVIQNGVSMIQDTLNRIVHLTSIMRYTVNLSYFITLPPNTTPINATQNLLMEAVSQFNIDNSHIAEKINHFSTSLSTHFFEKKIKFYARNDVIQDTTTDFLLVDSFQGVSLLSGHVFRVAESQNLLEKNFLHSMEFTLRNAFNDLLIKLEEQPNQVHQELLSVIDSTQIKSVTFILVTSFFFLVAAVLLITVYTKSYYDTKNFLEYFISYAQSDINTVVAIMNWFKQLLGSLMQDDSLAKEVKAKNWSFNNYIYKKGQIKSSRKAKLMFMIWWRIVIQLIFFTVPIITLVILYNSFTVKFDSVDPVIIDIIQTKEVLIKVGLATTETTLYAARPHAISQNQDISSIVEENIEGLDNQVLSSFTNSKIIYYPLYHLDFCQYVNKQDYESCKGIYRGISTAGLTGSVLAIQSLLRTYKLAIEANDTIVQEELFYNLSIPNTYALISYMREAIEVIERERVEELVQDLEDCQNELIRTSVVSVLISVILGILAALYVYLPSKRERESICKIMLLFPPNMIIQNKLLRPFLVKNSASFHELFKIGQYV